MRTWRETYASGAWQGYHEEAIATADAVRANLLLPDDDKGTKPTARAAALLAMTKSLVETPTLALLDPSATLRSLPSSDEKNWVRKRKTLSCSTIAEKLAREDQARDLSLTIEERFVLIRRLGERDLQAFMSGPAMGYGAASAAFATAMPMKYGFAASGDGNPLVMTATARS